MKKLGLKEELELEITNIKTEKIKEGKELKREDLIELSRIGATIESYGVPAEGVYKDYFFEVDENYKVTIMKKLEGKLPTITAEVIADGSKTTAEIQVTASIDEGKIKSIEATNGALLKESEENTDTKKTFVVNETGTYYFKATSNIGKTSVAKVEVNSLVEKRFLFKEGVGRENWDFATNSGTTLNKNNGTIYMHGASIYGDGNSGFAIAYFKEPIDLTKYSRLCVELEATTTQSGYAGGIGVSEDHTKEWISKVNDACTRVTTTTNTTVEYIIPEKYTKYSPSIWVGNGNSGTYSEVIVYNVWLEE